MYENLPLTASFWLIMRMSSLAQAIIDTASALAVPSKTGLHPVLKKAVQAFAQSAQDRAISHRAAHLAIGNIQGYVQDLPLLAKDISQSMRFKADYQVMRAVEKMHKTPFNTLIKALPYARLPYPKTWIEYTLAGGNTKLGWMIEQTSDGLIVKQAISTITLNHLPIHVAGSSTFKIDQNGFHLVHPSPLREPSAIEIKDKIIDDGCRTALSLLLLLNSRSNILKIEDAPDLERLNKQRSRRGKSALLSLRSISFDVARILGKKPGISVTSAFEAMAAALVRGHFKIRKTGVFFWSPYVRGAADETEKQDVINHSLQRERITTKSGQSTLPFAPV